MQYYPQLSSGSVCQYPIEQHTNCRTVTNELLSGNVIRATDPGAALVSWQLEYSGLANNEWSSIEQLFLQCEGRLRTFTFLDPTSNILMWSEDWTQAVWTADPMLVLSAGAYDPSGKNNAVSITNTSQTRQRITQSTAGPSWFHYCYSVFLRADTPGGIELVTASGGEEAITTVQVNSTWTRVASRATLAAQRDGIAFGLQLAPGTNVQAFGAQVEAQPSPGSYKKTSIGEAFIRARGFLPTR